MIRDTCDVIWDNLHGTEMPQPSEVDWKDIAERFYVCWNFPNCIGVLDGKHIVIQSPSRSGSLYYNYKGTFSIVLMALIDADYKFTFIDRGDYGSNADGSIFRNSASGQAFINGQLNMPGSAALPNFPEGHLLPHCIVADEAFPLRMDLMRPYPRVNRNHLLSKEQQIFNYRLSRARRTVENAFGILAQRFRVFNRRLQLHPDNVDRVIKACCVLHNYLSVKKDLPTLFNRLNPDNDPYL